MWGRVAVGAGERALERSPMVFDIFTDSSSSCGARNAKRCVCTGGWCPSKGAAFSRRAGGALQSQNLRARFLIVADDVRGGL